MQHRPHREGTETLRHIKVAPFPNPESSANGLNRDARETAAYKNSKIGQGISSLASADRLTGTQPISLGNPPPRPG